MPVSNLNIFEKIVEDLMKVQLIKYIDDNNKILTVAFAIL